LSAATNKAIVRRYIEQVLNEQRLDLTEEFLTENIELHGSGLAPGLQVMKQWFATFANAFPDGYTTIEDMVAEAEKVVARTTFNGTHQDEIQGIPATGKTISMLGISGSPYSGWTMARSLKAGWSVTTRE